MPCASRHTKKKYKMNLRWSQQIMMNPKILPKFAMRLLFSRALILQKSCWPEEWCGCTHSQNYIKVSSVKAMFVTKKASGWSNLVKADVQKNWTTCVPISDELSQVPGGRKDPQVINNKVCEWDLSSYPKLLSIMAHGNTIIQIEIWSIINLRTCPS